MGRKLLFLYLLVVGCSHDRVHLVLQVRTFVPAPLHVACELEVEKSTK